MAEELGLYDNDDIINVTKLHMMTRTQNTDKWEEDGKIKTIKYTNACFYISILQFMN